jgi:hypothetical protein
MVDVDIQTVSIAIASTGVFLAAIYYIFQIRHQTKMRQTDIIMRLHSIYISEAYQKATARVKDTDYKDYDDFVKKYGSPSPNDVQISLQMVGTFFEGLGVLLSEKLLDINLIQKLFAVEKYWKKAEPIVKELRKQSDASLWEWFEYLYNEVKNQEKKFQQSAA